MRVFCVHHEIVNQKYIPYKVWSLLIDCLLNRNHCKHESNRFEVLWCCLWFLIVFWLNFYFFREEYLSSVEFIHEHNDRNDSVRFGCENSRFVFIYFFEWHFQVENDYTWKSRVFLHHFQYMCVRCLAWDQHMFLSDAPKMFHGAIIHKNMRFYFWAEAMRQLVNQWTKTMIRIFRKKGKSIEMPLLLLFLENYTIFNNHMAWNVQDASKMNFIRTYVLHVHYTIS